MAIQNDRLGGAVPVIDLGLTSGAEPGPDRPATWPPESVVDQVGSAAERFGFFQVVGHGLEPELIDRVWDRTRACM